VKEEDELLAQKKEHRETQKTNAEKELITLLKLEMNMK
jgi:hypothetical protein